MSSFCLVITQSGENLGPVHHHHQVARPAVSIAVSTTERHLERSCARSHAELRQRLVGCSSDSMVRSQVRRGRPLRRRQSVGRRLMAAWRAREWSCDGSARAICPNRCNRLATMVEVTGGCPVCHYIWWIDGHVGGSVLSLSAMYGELAQLKRCSWVTCSQLSPPHGTNSKIKEEEMN